MYALITTDLELFRGIVNALTQDLTFSHQGTSPLHKITWLRIVLDEGHVIRNARSSQSIAAVSLDAKRRWVLTGSK